MEVEEPQVAEPPVAEPPGYPCRNCRHPLLPGARFCKECQTFQSRVRASLPHVGIAIGFLTFVAAYGPSAWRAWGEQFGQPSFEARLLRWSLDGKATLLLTNVGRKSGTPMRVRIVTRRVTRRKKNTKGWNEVDIWPKHVGQIEPGQSVEVDGEAGHAKPAADHAQPGAAASPPCVPGRSLTKYLYVFDDQDARPVRSQRCWIVVVSTGRSRWNPAWCMYERAGKPFTTVAPWDGPEELDGPQ